VEKPFIGSEALAAGELTRHELRTRYDAIHPDVYVAKPVSLTAATRAMAAWLWTGRRGVVAGRSAAALLGAKWVDDDKPAQVLHANRRAPRPDEEGVRQGVDCWSDSYAADEVHLIRGIPTTTPARTALDLACRLRIEDAVAAIDALAHATGVDIADVMRLADRHRGRRSIRRARIALDLVDGGAESPQETRLRLLYIRAGFPRPVTQIPVCDEYGYVIAELDMGWPDAMIAADYEGDHHRLTRRTFNNDIRRHDAVIGRGWDDMRITAEDPDAVIVERARLAFERRGRSLDVWAGRRFPWDRAPNVRSRRETA
jgi:hypothetical protein